MVDASCSCGYGTRLYVMFGFSAMEDEDPVHFLQQDEQKRSKGRKAPFYFLVPAYCPNCKEMFTVDRKHGKKTCESCGGKAMLYGRNKRLSPQHNDPLHVTPFPRPGASNGSSDGHLCPRCQMFTLSFSYAGNWD